MPVRPGHCPSCDAPFDADRHFPMVSVVCGHSLCEQCAAAHSTTPNPSPTTSPTNPETNSSSSSSDDDDDDEHHSPPPPCPVCNALLAGFVKNFEAVAALNLSPAHTQTLTTTTTTSVTTATTHPVALPAPDLSAVVHRDLVIRRADILFTRSPLSEVGRGASAVVYRGSYASQPVAVKCIRTMSESFTAEDRLRRELRNASRLQHPHIVQFRGAAWDHEAGPTSPRNILLVTELMAGGNLRENLNRLSAHSSCVPVEHFVRIALHVARGILYLHDEGLAHRDIKSANILLTQPLSLQNHRFPASLMAKIADFGLSKYIDKATGGGTVMQSLMEPGRLEATYSYLAPEAFGGDKSNVIRRNDSDDDDEPRYDEMAKKRDIYALGVLFWEILTAKIPWAGVSLPDVYVRVCVRSDRPAPALDDAVVSKSVRRLVERCWAQNPLKRPSAKSIVAKLEKLAARAAPPVAANVPQLMARVGQRPDMHAEPLHEHADLPPQHPAYPQKRTPSEPLIVYQKMPSASTVCTAPEGAKTHSTGFEGNEDRIVEEFPAPLDDSAWVDDGDATSRSHGQRSLQSNPGASSSARGNDPNDASSSIKRRLSRSRHSPHDHPEQNHNRFSVAPGLQPSATSSVTPSPSPVSPAPKAKATAVAATAAAIAAAKDRERKRDDVRATRAQVNRISRPPPPAGEASFQSLPGVEPWQKVVAKPNDMRPVFYENSDEEANDFDPERAAAEEALAEPNNHVASQGQQANSRVGTCATNAVSSATVSAAAQPRPQSQAVRSTSVSRLSRPKSPVVRRPISPMVARPFSSAQNQTRIAGEDEFAVRPSTSLPRNSDASIPKKTKSSGSRGRLGRTMSASASQAPDVNRASTPVFKSSSAAPVAGTTEPTGKRAFIRRMRSNEMNRRMARSSSSADVENKRRQNAAVKATRSYASESVQQTGNENVHYTVVQVGSGPMEDFARTVDSLDKDGLMQLFAERMAPLRLAALAHAALISDKYSAEEEIIRNSCAILHKLTVLENQTSQKNSVHSLSSKEQLSIRKYLTAMHGVDALLSVLHPPEKRHPTTLSYCFLALGNLNAWDLEARRQFRNSHGVLHIAEVMVVHRNNNGVQEKGSYALACVGGAYPPKAKYIFEQAGALDVVIQALSAVQGENPNNAVTKQACAALGAMCSSCPSNAQYSANKDALQYLIAAFERFRRASRVDGGKRGEMRLVCKAFMDLLCHPENRKLAGSIGGSTMIIRAMRIFRLDADFIEKGLTMLSDFCTYRSNGMQIVQAGGVDDIVAAMERFRLSVTMQKEGSRVLTLLMKATGDQARRRMVHAGGAEAIVFALERFGAIPDNNVPVVVETCRALHMLFLMENTAEGEILGKRMKKVRCDKAIKTAMVTHKTSPQVQEKGREALKQLGHLKGGGGIFGRMRSGAKRR
ncbi:Serine/threonine-protein kinase HT1 [Gracilariopsis chorda]|uniref:Serine/threonine-protein kinase HT1 n=1 Tax=Gracilariopsis chorda TaxID=448386 RepID=A0A2V3IJ03_9FLOR|nr:Serine/threonine-protein kinase HT1 [Gracilariopsis chorda]|eukprot:PXF42039.1 Serine/threonine-protein kinase HT1 [Gracilariopsis chorda]